MTGWSGQPVLVHQVRPSEIDAIEADDGMFGMGMTERATCSCACGSLVIETGPGALLRAYASILGHVQRANRRGKMVQDLLLTFGEELGARSIADVGQLIDIDQMMPVLNWSVLFAGQVNNAGRKSTHAVLTGRGGERLVVRDDLPAEMSEADQLIIRAEMVRDYLIEQFTKEPDLPF